MHNHNISLLFLVKYSPVNGASSRYRSYQYIIYLRKHNIDCKLSYLFDDSYIASKYGFGKANWLNIGLSFIKHLVAYISAQKFNLILIENEILPYFPALPELLLNRLHIPYVVDYDDALFHKYDLHQMQIIRCFLGSKIAQVMRGSKAVIAGNAYIADYALRAGARHVEIFPTVVDLQHYSKAVHAKPDNQVFTIGWIGSPSTMKYLTNVALPLARICAMNPARLRLIGAGKVELPGVPVEYCTWNEATEVALLRTLDVGIMPLVDSPWERGKCGLKLIQYMACGLPVVASPVGVNAQIVRHGENGFLASTPQEWEAALAHLLMCPSLRQRMGASGRALVENQYTVQVQAPRLAKLLRSLAA